jgi:hypothetical protein
MQQNQYQFSPSSGSGRHSEQGSPMTENAVNSMLSPHPDAEHQRTLDPERHENTRRRSVRDWGGESWNVLRTWFRSGWEQGEWP